MLTLTEKIQNEFIGSRYDDAGDACEKLTAIVGTPCRCYCSEIADGVYDDESEDCYVMKDCFDFEGSNLVVRIYYGNITKEIGYVDVAEY